MTILTRIGVAWAGLMLRPVLAMILAGAVLLGVAVLWGEWQRSQRIDTEAELARERMRAAGAVVAERATRSELSAALGEMPRLRAQIETLRSRVPGTRVVTVTQRVTAHSPVAGDPIPPADTPSGPARGPEQEAMSCPPCWLDATATLSCAVQDAELMTRDGGAGLVGRCVVRRESPPPRTVLLDAPLAGTRLSLPAIATPVRARRWSVGPMVGATNDGLVYGGAVLGPELTAWGGRITARPVVVVMSGPDVVAAIGVTVGW